MDDHHNTYKLNSKYSFVYTSNNIHVNYNHQKVSLPEILGSEAKTLISSGPDFTCSNDFSLLLYIQIGPLRSGYISFFGIKAANT